MRGALGARRRVGAVSDPACLLQWPTLLTLVMCPILVWMHARMARRDVRESTLVMGVNATGRVR